VSRDLSHVMKLAARLVLPGFFAAACSASNYQSSATIPSSGSEPIPHAIVHIFGGTDSYKLSDVIVAADSVIGLL
jgi:hypothetical protein